MCARPLLGVCLGLSLTEMNTITEKRVILNEHHPGETVRYMMDLRCNPKQLLPTSSRLNGVGGSPEQTNYSRKPGRT